MSTEALHARIVQLALTVGGPDAMLTQGSPDPTQWMKLSGELRDRLEVRET